MPNAKESHESLGSSGELTVFLDDDAGYLAWLKANPGGFVLNANRSPTRGYLKLHRATCWSINGTPPRGELWTSVYLKACSPSRLRVESWSRNKVGAEPERCGQCWGAAARR